MCTSLFTWYPGRRRRPCSRRTRASTRAEIWSSQSVSHSDCSSFSQSYCMYCRFADLISGEKKETDMGQYKSGDTAKSVGLSVILCVLKVCWPDLRGEGTAQERRNGQVSQSLGWPVIQSVIFDVLQICWPDLRGEEGDPVPDGQGSVQEWRHG